ncbi:MAG: FAD:protein FMN transferase, partial [Xanthomonadales bacterium]|nr:FAD:protein FMN transferase [Xanthomonadales bacterium]NIX12866.1 FAD:protein FMN transferase [Xanthomonadales bacterium]
GPGDWPAVARDLGLDQVLVIDEAGKVHQTPAMAERVRFTGNVDHVVVPLGAKPVPEPGAE